MASLNSLKMALRQMAVSSTKRSLSDEQYSAGFAVLMDSGERIIYHDFIVPQLCQLLTPLFDFLPHTSVLEIGPGPKTVLASLPRHLRRKIKRYTAFEPNHLFASRLTQMLTCDQASEPPLPCLEAQPYIHRVPFLPRMDTNRHQPDESSAIESNVVGNNRCYKRSERIDVDGIRIDTGGTLESDLKDDTASYHVILFIHSMYGMKPKRAYIERALRLLEPGGLVVTFHRDAELQFDNLICNQSATWSSGILHIPDKDEILDDFVRLIAGFTLFDTEANDAVRLRWRDTCRHMGRCEKSQYNHQSGHLIFIAPTSMVTFSSSALSLPELTAKVPLLEQSRRIKNPESRLRLPVPIVKPTTIQQVQQCVYWALKHRHSLTVLGGSHGGHCVRRDTVAIDMSAFNQSHVLMAWGKRDNVNGDDEKRPGPYESAVVVGTGCTTEDIIRTAMIKGITVPLGSRPSVGAGLWLQGGIGHLTRKYGLTCDAILGAVLVSVSNGQVFCVGHVPGQHQPAEAIRPDNEDDLLWALRGAGTNIGIVISVTFKAFPAPIYSIRNWVIPVSDKLQMRRRLEDFDELIARRLPRDSSIDAYLYCDSDELCLGVSLYDAVAESSGLANIDTNNERSTSRCVDDSFTAKSSKASTTESVTLFNSTNSTGKRPKTGFSEQVVTTKLTDDQLTAGPLNNLSTTEPYDKPLMSNSLEGSCTSANVNRAVNSATWLAPAGIARTILGPEGICNVTDGVGVFEAEMYLSTMHGGHGGKTSSFKRCLFLRNISASPIVDVLIDALDDRPSPLCYLHLLQGGGAVSELRPNASAFGCRDWDYACVITGTWIRDLDGTDASRHVISWVYRVAMNLLPLSSGTYGADLGPDHRDTALAAAAFGPNRPRLALIKECSDRFNVLPHACPILREQQGPRHIILVTGKSWAGKDHCANIWAQVFTQEHIKAHVSSISDAIKREYATTTGTDLGKLLQDRRYKERHRPALTEFFLRQRQYRPQLLEDQFLQVVHSASDVDVLFITGMRDEAPVTTYSHLVPYSMVIEVYVHSSENVRRARQSHYRTNMNTAERNVREDQIGFDSGARDFQYDHGLDEDGKDTDYDARVHNHLKHVNLDHHLVEDRHGSSSTLNSRPDLVFENNTNRDRIVKFAHDQMLPYFDKDLDRLVDMIHSTLDFPRPGMRFRHLLGISQSQGGLTLCASLLQNRLNRDWSKIDAIACCEAGGFIFASPLAARLDIPLLIMRNAGKLPPPTIFTIKSPSNVSSLASASEGPEKRIEMTRDLVPPGASVVLLDDVLATGNTLLAMLKLLRIGGIQDVSVLVVAEFPKNQGRKLLQRHGFGGVAIQSLLTFGGD